MSRLPDILEKARRLSWKHWGRAVTFYIPGMFRLDGMAGKYQAISITGNACALNCGHCKGKLLEQMLWAPTPEALVSTAVRLAEQGNLGILISGGCDGAGRLPWDRFLAAIRTVKRETGLYISVHSGLIDLPTATGLKEAGVDQALIDVVGDDDTYARIYGPGFRVSAIAASLTALEAAGLDIVPHIVCGLNHGRMAGEYRAVELVSRFRVRRLVIVSVMPLGAEWRKQWTTPTAEEVARLIAAARTAMPRTVLSLGCARERGNRRLETLALDAGVNGLALPSDEAVARAGELGLRIEYRPTCCSVFSRGPGKGLAGETLPPP